MKKNRLSHSQVSRYQMCGKSYEYYYVKKIRPNVTSGALLFGSALDSALNELLLPKKDKKPEDVFDANFTRSTINDRYVYVPDCLEVVYGNNDFDADLLDARDLEQVQEWMVKKGITFNQSLLQRMAWIKKLKKDEGWPRVPDEDKQFYNYMNWLSMRRKGHLMLTCYRNNIQPKFNKVHEVQKFIKLSNDDGDEIIGYVDLVADVEGHGTVILDNKTSAMEYEKDAVLTSPQLSVYVHMIGEEYKTRKAGYIVLRKGIIKNRKKVCRVCGNDGSGKRHKTCDAMVDEKRCNGEWTETIAPEVDYQILIDEIPPITEQIVLENFDEINDAIKQEVFPRNFNSCQNTYGGPCPYVGLCFKDDMKGLEKKGQS